MLDGICHKVHTTLSSVLYTLFCLGIVIKLPFTFHYPPTLPPCHQTGLGTSLMLFLSILYTTLLSTTVISIQLPKQASRLSRVSFHHILCKGYLTYPVFSPYLLSRLKLTGTSLLPSRWPSLGQRLKPSASLHTTPDTHCADCGQRPVTLWTSVTSFILQSIAFIWNTSHSPSTPPFNLKMT